jgi:PAS domain S-box-containing protein
METLQQAFRTADLTPHGFCLLWRPDLLLLNIGADSIIGLSYYAIPIALAYFVWKRRDIVFGWVFWMFAAFILACGTTHWFEIWTLWRPDYGVQGAIKLVTAVFSASTAVALALLMPRALALPSPSQYRQVRTALSSEVEQRYQVTKTLQQTEARYQQLVESIADYAIFSTDRQGGIKDWNRGAEQITGFRADEVIGQHFSIFYTSTDRDGGEPVTTLEKALHEGRYETEALRVRKDGSRFWANVVIDPIRDHEGNLIGFANITRDVSQHRELEERLRQSQKMEAIGKLTGGVAHDFSNHLTVIYWGLDRAKRMATDNPALSRALETARMGANRAASVTGQLLALHAASHFRRSRSILVASWRKHRAC